jgi:hypothetical protein
MTAVPAFKTRLVPISGTGPGMPLSDPVGDSGGCTRVLPGVSC